MDYCSNIRYGNKSGKIVKVLSSHDYEDLDDLFEAAIVEGINVNTGRYRNTTLYMSKSEEDQESKHI